MTTEALFNFLEIKTSTFISKLNAYYSIKSCFENKKIQRFYKIWHVALDILKHNKIIRLDNC